MGGELIDEDSGSFGLRDLEDTQEFARYLQAVTPEQLLSRVNYRQMATKKIHDLPRGSQPDAVYEEEVRRIVSEDYPKLRDYVMKAAAAQHGLLVWMA
jgi:hypothetical protein